MIKCNKVMTNKSIILWLPLTILIFLSLVIGLPLLLNCTLRACWLQDIIGSPVDWLLFWGSYLAAIGSAFLGWVAVLYNRKAINQITIKHHAESLQTEYDKMEELVTKAEYVHSFDRFKEIQVCGNDRVMLEKCYKLKFQLSSKCLQACRFNSPSNGKEKYPEELVKYGHAISSANTLCLKILNERIINVLEQKVLDKKSNASVDWQMVKEEFEKPGSADDVSSCYQILYLRGMDLLIAKNKEVTNINKKV